MAIKSLDTFDFSEAANYLLKGKLIVFFGAGASLASQLQPLPENTHILLRQLGRLPLAGELSDYLLKKLFRKESNASELIVDAIAARLADKSPPIDPSNFQLGRIRRKIRKKVRRELRSDLGKVSEVCECAQSEQWVYDALNSIFSRSFSPSPLHQAVASIVNRQKANPRTTPAHAPLIITTNYDSILETALDEQQTAYDKVVYRSDRNGGPMNKRGCFVHSWSDQPGVRVDITNSASYTGFSMQGTAGAFLNDRPVVLKIHGSAEKEAPLDSYVITQDDYINYLVQMNVENFLPSQLAGILTHHRFLFLGYGLGDNNLQALLAYFWSKNKIQVGMQAIQKNPKEVEGLIWRKRGVTLYDGDLVEFGNQLNNALDRLAPLTPRPRRTEGAPGRPLPHRNSAKPPQPAQSDDFLI